MKIYRFLLLGTILFIFSCGGGGKSTDMTGYVSPGELTVTVDKPYVIGVFNPEVDAKDNIAVTVSGGTGPYSLTVDNPIIFNFDLWPGSPAPTVTIDPDSVATATGVFFAATDANGHVAHTKALVLPIGTVVGPLEVVLITSNDLPCGAPAVTVFVIGGVPPYTVTSLDLTLGTIAGSPVAGSGGSFTVLPKLCDVLAAGDYPFTVRIVDTDLVPTTLDVTFILEES